MTGWPPRSSLPAAADFADPNQSEDEMTEALGERLIRAAAAKDFLGAGSLLAPDVEFRALTPQKLFEAHSREAVLGVLRLVSPADAMRPRGRQCRRPPRRSLPDSLASDEEGRFVFEQQAYDDVADGQITRIHLVCSGDRPIESRIAWRQRRPVHRRRNSNDWRNGGGGGPTLPPARCGTAPTTTWARRAAGVVSVKVRRWVWRRRLGAAAGALPLPFEGKRGHLLCRGGACAIGYAVVSVGGGQATLALGIASPSSRRCRCCRRGAAPASGARSWTPLTTLSGSSGSTS